MSLAKQHDHGQEQQHSAEIERLLARVHEVAGELHLERAASLQVRLDSDFDGELGFDSIGRAELLTRVAREFEVRLPEELLTTCDTPYDLLSALLTAERVELGSTTADLRLVFGAAARAPDRVHTLIEVLDWHVHAHPERVHVLLSDGEREREQLSYGELDGRARELATGLREAHLIPGDRVAIMLPTGADFLASFFGVLYAGGVPVPIYPPARMSQLQEHMRRQAAILANAGAQILITVPAAVRVGRVLEARVATLETIVTPRQLRVPGARTPPVRREAEDLAFLQYTSGSTGDPKGVMLSHANLLANIRAMIEAMTISDEDVLVSWLPLYHDMGLIGAWLSSLYVAAPLVLMSPLAFLLEPTRWLRTIDRRGGTLSAAPNFAYELCLRKVDPGAWAGLDLSSWRLALNGAEPVSPTTVRDFCERFAASGFRREAMYPVYGLAENAVGLSFPPLGRGPWIDRIDRAALEREGVATPLCEGEEGERGAIEFVCCGEPLPGHELRVVDPDGRESAARHQGRLQFRGPSATQGYFDNPGKTKELIAAGEWRETGDLAYVAEGQVFITGRTKDMIIRAGRNIYPQELEERIGAIEGIRRGCVAVFGCDNPDSGTERLIVVAETRERDPARLAQLRARIDELTTALFDAAPEEVVLAPPHTVRKTSSGKIRRATCRQLYEAGQLQRRSRVWTQLLRLGLAGAWARVRRSARSLGHVLYAIWFWSVALGVALGLWLMLLVLPRARWRWAALRLACRSIFRLTGISLKVEGQQPEPGTIVVANHASYLDSLVMAAALPGQLAILAKGELQANFAVRSLLSRAGVIFVERFDPRRALAAADAASVVAGAGQNPMIFPEGATTRRPGLAGFRLGAFRVAVESRRAVVPVVIRGSRDVLRSQSFFPRPGRIEVEIGPPMHPRGEDWSAAVELRDRARGWILERCGEPDLGGEEHPLVTRLRRGQGRRGKARA